jgi:transcriptional regulator with PAS, ATPase and Fis domain
LSKAGSNAASRPSGGGGLGDTVRTVCSEINRKSRTLIVGQSAEWQAVLKKAAQVAATDTTVLVSGESGTGKEVVARFIHQASARKSGPFVALNCAALPEQLLEAELFGYERGAFTGAQQAKPGQIELAAGGVLFLDEVSEMSLTAQAKFLRVLQEREFQRLGGTRLIKANIRVVAATNRDLRAAVERGDFREDLFYRLQVFDIHIPPLRARRADIVPLSDVFLQELGGSLPTPPAGLAPEARETLVQYDWPGNVRELRNALERAAILSQGGLITPQHLRLELPVAMPHRDTTDLGTVERTTIAKVLQDCRWNKSDAARRLGLSRTQLYVRMRRYHLEEAATA